MNGNSFIRSSVLALALGTITLAGCADNSERARLISENRQLRDNVSELERKLATNKERTLLLNRQLEQIQGFSPDRPVNLFAPVKIEFASLSGGANYDDLAGDDGMTVYVRPVDADGSHVKVPGRLTVQLLDNTDLDRPRVIGTYTLDDPEMLRKSWYSRFGSNHYTLKCPFPENAVLPDSGKLNVAVEFLDFRTGRSLTTVEELEFNLGGE